jgi:DNA-binding transcriptional ArsR family regulator
MAPAVALFRSLGDPARLAIVSRLAQGEARVVDLTLWGSTMLHLPLTSGD